MTQDQYKAERTKRNLTQAQLAALLGVSRVTINGRETGHKRYPISVEAGLAVQALPLPDAVAKKVTATIARREMLKQRRDNPLYVVHPTKGEFAKVVELAKYLEENGGPNNPLFAGAPVDTSKWTTSETMKDLAKFVRKERKAAKPAMTAEEIDYLKRLENPQLKKK